LERLNLKVTFMLLLLELEIYRVVISKRLIISPSKGANLEESKITLELTLREADIIRRSLQKNTPPKDDEMLATMLYYKIEAKIAEVTHE
jgi:hypothetical protein